MINDVRRAYFNAPVRRRAFVQLPDEDPEKNGRQKCGELVLSMYGTRDAAQNWARCYSKHLEEIGFTKGKTTPGIFLHKHRNIMTLVHGDDYLSTGEREDLIWMNNKLNERFDIKTIMIGGGAGDAKEAKVLNRVIRFAPDAIEYEADQRHSELIIQETGMEAAKPVGVTGQTQTDEKEEGQHMETIRETEYRSIAARINYLAQDRADIQFAAKEICKDMSSPRASSWLKVKAVGKYLSGRRRLVWRYPWMGSVADVAIFSDVDWGGCKITRKSTSGGCLMMSGHLLKSWSKSQHTISLSTAESELYAGARAVQEGLGVASIYRDFGIEVACRVHMDAKAALAIIAREGLGKMRHVDTAWLWLQQVREGGKAIFQKISGDDNPADAMTKYVDKPKLIKHMARMGGEFRDGRADSALKVAQDCD